MNKTLLSAAALAAALITSPSLAADLYVDMPMAAAPVEMVSPGQWDGPYVGVFGGYAAGIFEYNSEGTLVDLDASGWLIGANVGFDKTLDNGLVIGIVGDAAWTNVEINDPIDMKIDFVGSLRGRVGFDGGVFLPYLTGGVAAAHLVEDDESAMLIGWTIGGGVEFAATDDLSVDVQYRYSDYGNSSDLADHGYRSHQITAGLNWRF